MKQLIPAAFLLSSFICLSITVFAQQELGITLITSDYQGFNVSCFGGKDGWITCNPTGGTPPYTYHWSTGSTDQTITDLLVSYYSVSVTDAASNSLEIGINLTTPDKMSVSHSYTNSNCYHCFSGTISISVIGGVTPYSYLWNDGPDYPNRSGLGSGSYELLVTDANGCSNDELDFYISEPPRDDWALVGTTGSNPSIQFLGTTDSKDLSLRTNNAERLRIGSNGSLKINGLAGGGASNYLYVDQNGILQRGPGGGVGLPWCHYPVMPWFSDDPDLENIYTCTTRKVGIGTSTPEAHLHVKPDIYNGILISYDNTVFTGNAFQIKSSSNISYFTINADGTTYTGNKMGINTAYIPNSYSLAVGGKIICEEVKVKLRANWPDYVFEKGYNKMSMFELEMFIEENHHLPGLPPAKELNKDGISVGEMESKLLQKIEELTLYMIEQNKQIEELNKKINDD